MRRNVTASMCAVAVALLMVPGGVSADVSTVVSDDEGDVPVGWDMTTGEPTEEQLSGNAPASRVGYFDMLSYSLSLNTEASIYTYWMELSADLPLEGDALPSGVKIAEWALWVEDGVWNPVLNPVTTWFVIALTYDGASYDAYVLDYQTKEVVTSLEDIQCAGAEFQISFSADSIGNRESFYWMASTRVWWGQPDTWGFRFQDFTDWDAYAGDLGYDIPWLPEL